MPATTLPEPVILPGLPPPRIRIRGGPGLGGLQVTNDIFDLTDRVALITGGSRGIGRSIAEAYCRRGAKVVITARKQDELDETAAAISAEGGKVMAVASHAGREDDVDALLKEVMDAHGRIDILVNN